uniref:Alstrom syndrome protein 1 homolog n=1 Tax=Callorhinchus milii TaxID=7868 RepID=A0A4W3JIP2_CALMI
MNRPDFISHSRERVRRLELFAEERRLQSELQSERLWLFNPPLAHCSPPSRPLTENTIFWKKKITRKEMVLRSKRMYNQLSEVTRRREEEKRKAENRSNRLKAQLYKKVSESRTVRLRALHTVSGSEVTGQPEGQRAIEECEGVRLRELHTASGE